MQFLDAVLAMGKKGCQKHYATLTLERAREKANLICFNIEITIFPNFEALL